MSLSTNLISQFVKATKDTTETKKESTHYGTVVEYDGGKYVQLDGSELLTPVSQTTTVSDGERVTVMIKDHSATVTGNLSSPSVGTTELKEVSDQITEVEILVADKVSTEELEATNGRIDNLVSDNVTIKGELDAHKATIDDLTAENATITGKLTADEAEIENLKATKIDADIVVAEYAKIDDLEATNIQVNNLEATYGDFKVLTADRLDAAEADITDLKAKSADIESLDAKYANIDFANIGEAAIENFYAKSGIIEDIVISEGTVTGTLVGVTIKGDLIEGGTIVADKLVVQGEDGLYYKLNVDGETVEAEQTDYNSLNGSIITAQSITANKINVDDLVAFDATIGGFKITDSSIYSGVKESVSNTTRGIYLDDDGQAVFGDQNNYLKYYKDEDDTYKLDISAYNLVLSASNRNVDDALDEMDALGDNLEETEKKLDDTDSKIDDAKTQIELLDKMLSTLVTDENGASLMTQTSDGGWTFDISGIEQNLGNSNETLNNLMETVNNLSHTTGGLASAVENLEETSEYVWITTYEDEPCLALGESDSNNGLFITNTRIIFIKDSGDPTYITKDGLYTNKLEVGTEFRQKDYVWAIRANGNYGLSWKQIVLTALEVLYTGPDQVAVGTELSDLTGVVVRGTYSNDTVRSITSGYEMSGEIKSGTNTITVKYGDFKGTFTVRGVTPGIAQGEATSLIISFQDVSGVSDSTTVKYSDEVKIEDGVAVLGDSSSFTVTESTPSNANETYSKAYGKYVANGSEIYYVDPDATWKRYKESGTFFDSYVLEYTPAYLITVVSESGGDSGDSGGETEPTATSLTATYTGGSVEVGTALSDLTGLTVKVNYDDSTTKTVTDYTLSGTIAEGSNTIRVTWGSLTTTFKVTGVAASTPVISSLKMATGTAKDSNTFETGLSSITQFVLYRKTLSSTGLMNASYNAELGSKYAYCSSYGSYIKSGSSGNTSYWSISGGTVTWGATGSSTSMASGIEYTWIAFGEE